MKKINIMATIAVVAFAGVHVYRSLPASSELSDLQLENLEALATGREAGKINKLCPNGCVEGNSGCLCYDRYINLKEAKPGRKH